MGSYLFSYCINRILSDFALSEVIVLKDSVSHRFDCKVKDVVENNDSISRRLYHRETMN
jgi:hypothetical protein